MRKRLILTTAVFLGLFFALNAQNPSGKKKAGKGEKKEQRLDSIAKRYGLNETQKANFKTAVINKKTAQRSLKKKMKATTNKKELKNERKQIGQTFDSSVKVIFTAEQYAKFKSDRETKATEHRTVSAEKRSQQMADSMQARYGLSSAQHGRIKTAVLSLTQSKMAIKKKYRDSGLKEEAKKEIKAAKQKFDTTMKEILTEEQYKNWKADRKTRRKGKKKK